MTDGNLNRHLQVLQAAGVVGITKALNRSRMQTSCHITAVGHRRYMEYLAVIEQVLIDSGKTVDEHLDLRGHRPAVRFSEG